MIARRDLIMGVACLAAAAAGTGLKPRHEVPLLKGTKMADVVPVAFGDWTSEDIGDPLAVNGAETLTAKLYNELVVRAYTNTQSGAQLVMLLAYGGKQSDELQLHRPEVCYPAFGYVLARNEPLSLRIAEGVTVPARRLVAQDEGRIESVIYWSRMGELLPQDGSQQRAARLENAMKGLIPDGLLSRFSVAGAEPEQAWPIIEGFVGELVVAIRPSMRKVLIGSTRAQQIASLPSGAA